MAGTGFSFDKEKLHINVARLKKGHETFEVVIEPDLAMEFRKGKQVDIMDILKDRSVYSEARKGLRASTHRLEELFGTSDSIEVAKIIILKGEVQETAEHRAREIQEKRNKIVATIHKFAADPRNHLPHPMERIDAAIDEAKVKIDPNLSAEEQIDDVIKQIRVILPIKLETKTIEIRIGREYGAKCYSTVKSFGKITKDNWLGDGSWHAVVEVPAGMELDFYDKLNSMTHGNVETNVVKNS